MTKAMPFLRKYDITFLRPPPFSREGLAVSESHRHGKVNKPYP